MVAQDILALYVIGLAFVGVEPAQVETYLHLRRYVTAYAQCSKRGLEQILLLTVIIDCQVSCRLHRAERRTHAVRREAVGVHAVVSQEGYRPVITAFDFRLSTFDSPCHIRLIVEEVRTVVTFRLQRTEHVLRTLVAYAVHLAVRAVAHTYIDASALEPCRQRGLKSRRLLVAYIQHGGRLVAEPCIEPSGTELHVLHHLGIDKTQSLLLSGTYEQRTVNLYAVHIHGVLVKTAAAHVVLATHLVGLAHAGKRDQQALYASAADVGYDAPRSGVHTIHHILLALDTRYLYLCQLFARLAQFDIDIQHVAIRQ